ncbi:MULTISPECIES: ATP-binding protein [Vibrio]|uniref:ATP-binding protein n=1 Tax=Vibrio TaxID=662 RepID=UPI0012698095|nr:MULTISPECIES: ATP-binding protein [Vibrio]MCM5510023.1 hypothetical protein [Vibrio sp. SCSIO 43169]QFT39916.1 Sensor protein RstB [Vibrio sp. THAF64]QGM37577.1 Sensor protein RstB [Vibrio sp. THAF191d]QGN73302.1 Sensor protein RstB [Vibrio sp. THAF191c]WFB51180.1 ATP-binding protein [Vibrio coralliilyticus]
MFKLFFPIYLCIFSTWLSSGLLLKEAVITLFPESVASDIRHDFSGGMAMAEQLLLQTPEADWGSLLNTISSPNIPVKIVTPQALTASQKMAWLNGELVVTDVEHAIIIKRLLSDGRTLQFGPVSTHQTLVIHQYISAIGLTGLFAVGVVIWTWSLQRKLQHLKQALETFSSGKLSARASTKDGLRLGTLNAHFNTMASRLEDAITTNQRLAIGVSHELRAPLARIQFELEHARQPVTDSDCSQSLISIEDDFNELEALVDESLLYAKHMTYDTHEPTEFLTSTFLHQWLDNFKPLPQVRTIPILRQSSGLETEFLIDGHLLARALDNLLHNALRHAHSYVEVSWSLSSAHLSISVRDDGPGIAKPIQEQIFQPFFRAPKSGLQPGYGLGLYIAQGIIERHGWQIEANNHQHGGAVFTIGFTNTM